MFFVFKHNISLEKFSKLVVMYTANSSFLYSHILKLPDALPVLIIFV